MTSIPDWRGLSGNGRPEATRRLVARLEQHHALGRAQLYADFHGCTLDDIASRRRSRHIAHARQAICAYLREQGLSYPAIGEVMSLDHSSVMHAVSVHYTRMRVRVAEPMQFRVAV